MSHCRSCSTAKRLTGPAVRSYTRITAPTCCSTAPSSGVRSRRILPRARIASRCASNGAAARQCRSKLSRCSRAGTRGARFLMFTRRSRCRAFPSRLRLRSSCRAPRCAYTMTWMSAAVMASSAASSMRCWPATCRAGSAFRSASSRIGLRTCAAGMRTAPSAISTSRSRSTTRASSAR